MAEYVLIYCLLFASVGCRIEHFSSRRTSFSKYYNSPLFVFSSPVCWLNIHGEAEQLSSCISVFNTVFASRNRHIDGRHCLNDGYMSVNHTVSARSVIVISESRLLNLGDIRLYTMQPY